MKKLRYVGYALSVAFSVMFVIVAFVGNPKLDRLTAKSFGAEDYESYVLLQWTFSFYQDDTWYYDNFKIINKTNKSIVNLTLYGRLNAEISTYQIVRIGPKETYRLKVGLKKDTSNFTSFVKPVFWAEGELE